MPVRWTCNTYTGDIELRSCYVQLTGDWTMRGLLWELSAHESGAHKRRCVLTVGVTCSPQGLCTSPAEKRAEFAELAEVVGAFASAKLLLVTNYAFELGGGEGEEDVDGGGLWGDAASSPGDVRSFMSFFAEFTRALEPWGVAFNNPMGSVADEVVREAIEASASSNFDVDGGMPSRFLGSLARPSEMMIRGDGVFASCRDLERLCTSTLTHLWVSETVTSANFASLLGYCRHAGSSLVDLNVTVGDGDACMQGIIRSAATRRSLCDTRRFIKIACFPSDPLWYAPYHVLSEGAWGEAQEIKKSVRALFAAAAAGNALCAAPLHDFLNECGKDVKKKIVGYLL